MKANRFNVDFKSFLMLGLVIAGLAVSSCNKDDNDEKGAAPVIALSSETAANSLGKTVST